jgi:tetratricopeptide (TPR) repeat protein/predicted phosphodiesterase
MTGLTWIHLSDWHQAERKFNRKVVCDALKTDIKERGEINSKLRKIDFIVFSGDAANSGQPDEYNKAIEDLFKPLLEACELGRDKLFIVPGNHDLDRDLIPIALSKPLNSNEEVESWWSDDRKRKQLSQPFQAFNSFLTDCTGQKPPEFCSIGSFAADGRKIALLGINSTWMSARHKDEAGEFNDQGYLCIGEPQIYEPLENIKDFDIKIAVLHHPLDWLAPFDLSRNEVHLKRKCNFILHGHAHKPGASANRDNFGYYITIPAGACYDRSLNSNSDYTFSYNFVHLDFNTDKGVVFLRKWSDLNRIWRKDDETCPPNGEFHFSISGLDKAPIPHQVPPPPRDFKGREDEIHDLLSNFEKGATITGLRGMPGIGKTVLASVLAERLKERFSDGQLFINLQGTSKNPLSPVEAMAQVIHAYRPTDPLPKNQDELHGLYLSILAGKRALLLFDNAASKEQIEQLLPPANCAVLFTSRINFTLPGLKKKDLDVLPRSEACELLLGISERIGDRAEELAELCGYHPLALRNAASALAEKKDINVAEYKNLLEDKLKRLKLIEASFNLSYDLLSEERRNQWSRLSVFPGDFDLNGASAIWKMDRDASSEALSNLVNWSLVTFIPSADPEKEGRYKLHDLARIFACSHLDSSQCADAQYRHSKHYLKVLSEADNLYAKGGRDILPGLQLFDKEWVNIKAGQAWAESQLANARDLKKATSINRASKLANNYPMAASNVFILRLDPQDAIHWHEAGLKAARMRKDRVTENSHLHNLGLAYGDLGDIRKAIKCFERSLSRKRRIQYGKNEGNTLNSLGISYFDLGETRKAIEFCRQAQQIAIRIGDKKGEATATTNLGIAYLDLGEARKAIEYCEQALIIARDIENRRTEGRIIGNLGAAYSRLGQIRKAMEYTKQQLAIAREIRDLFSEGRSLIGLGDEYLDLGETGRAIGFYEQALEMSCDIRSQNIKGDALLHLGEAYSKQGENGRAIEYCKSALEIIRKIEKRNSESEALCSLGRAYAELGETNKAIENYNQALEIVRKTEFRYTESDALCNLGRIYHDLGDTSEAIEYYGQSLEIARKIEYFKGVGEASFYMSQSLDKLGQRQNAINSAKAALQIFEQIESPHAEKVRQKLAEWQASSPQEN